MPSWTELELVLHQLGVTFDGLRDDLVRLDGVVLAALPLIVSVRKLIKGVRSGFKPRKAKRSKAKHRSRPRPKRNRN